MIVATGPSFKAGLVVKSNFALLSVLEAPFFANLETEPPGLTPREVQPGVALLEPIPVPLLPGMDDIEVESASIAFAGGATDSVVSGTLSGGTVDLRLRSPAGTSGALRRIEINGFKLIQSDAPLGISSGNAAFLDATSGAMAIGQPPGDPRYLHLMLQALDGNKPGPPIAALPRFDMPGGGDMDYGPALGGGNMSLGPLASGSLPVTAEFAPTLAGRAFRLGLAKSPNGTSPTAGLPNEATLFSGWQASEIKAIFRTRPEDVQISLAGPGAPPTTVATYPGEMPAARSDTDLTPAFRAAAKAALLNAPGGDLGISLSIVSPTGGKVLLAVPRPRLRYIRRPLAAPAPISLATGFAELPLDLPRRLKPLGLSFALDGRYGPSRRIDSSPFPQGAIRQGYRLVPGRRMTVSLTLSQTEQLLPLARLAVFGRCEAAGELLLSLYHGGDTTPTRRMGPPVAVTMVPGLTMDWHGAPWAGAPPPAPPHPAKLWLVIEVGHGAFLQGIDQNLPADGALLCESDGASWSQVNASPPAGIWVDEIDPATGEPAPLHALDLHGPHGLLNGDLVDVVGKNRPAAFSLRWVAMAPAHDDLLSEIAAADAAFALRFACRRDVSMTVSDAVLTYDPWTARS